MTFRSRLVRVPLLVGGSVLSGALVGLLSAIYHAALFPWGLALSVILVALFLIALRALWPTRLLALTGALGAVGVIVAAAGADPSGSVLIMADPAGLSFVVAVTFVTAVVLAWPRFSTRPTSYDRDAGTPERTLPQ